MKYFDTHAHLNFKNYKKDGSSILKKTLERGVFVINVGTDVKTSKKAVSIAKKFHFGVYASLGIHPLESRAGSDPARERRIFEDLAKNKEVIAIGETGLDYINLQSLSLKEREKIKKTQEELFKRQINLAKKLHLPLILHCRKAHKDMLKILKEEKASKGVVHCFTGSVSQMKEYIDLGFYIGVNGIIFKMNLRKVIKKTPLKKILLETDCPFLSPPLAKKKRNEPLFISYIADEVARIKKIDVKEVSEETSENGKKLFSV